MLVAKVDVLGQLAMSPHDTTWASDLVQLIPNRQYHPDYVFEALEELTSERRVDTTPGPPWTTAQDATYARFKAQITDAGAAWLKWVEEEQGNSLKRAKAAREACLGWLVTQLESDQPPAEFRVEEMTGFDHYYGRPFSEAEIEAAADWLVHNKYVDGLSVDQAAVLFPKLTSKGEWAMSSNESVSDLESGLHAGQGATYNTLTNSGQIGVVQMAGAQSAQSATVTIDNDQREAMGKLVEAYEEVEAHLVLTEEDRAVVDAAVVDIRGAAADPATTRGAAREVVAKLHDELTTRAAGFMANSLVLLAVDALHVLGS